MLVAAQQEILVAWLVIGAVVLGLGLGVQAPLARASELWLAFWVGFGVLLTFLQLWHLGLPIDERTRIAAGVLATLGLARSRLRLWRLAGVAFVRHAPVVVVVVGCAWWLSNRSLAGPSHGDTGMYFVPAIRWLETYPIVPGLANLFVPLGHNFSYFLYVALLDTGTFADRPWHVANGFLLLPLFGRAALAAARLLRRSAESRAPELYYLYILPALVELACGILLTSPAPDFAVYIVGFLLAGELLAFVTAPVPTRRRCLSLVFLAAAGMTVKGSLAVLALATIGVAIGWWWRRTRPDAAAVVRVLALAAVVSALPVVTWVGRNVVTSGNPLYPSPLGALPVEWRTHHDAVAWIQAPMQFPARALLQTPGWAYNRLVMMGWGDPEVALPVVLLGIASCIALFAGIVRWWRGRRGAVTPLILIPPVLSVPFVLLNAPMPRFQGATLWVLPIEVFLVGFSGALAGMPGWVRAGLVVLAVAGTALPLCRSESPFLPLDDFQPVSKSSVAPQELASGFTVYMPLTSHNCFDGPLPCTPEPHPGLRLRRPPDLVGGFVIDDGVEGPPRPATGSGP